LKDIELDGSKLEITYKPKYHEMKAEQYKDSPQTSKKHGFNAFRNQHLGSNTNKRKSSAGFGRNSNKKNKTNAVEEEAKKEEAKNEETN
jgi:lupus La protein